MRLSVSVFTFVAPTKVLGREEGIVFAKNAGSLFSSERVVYGDIITICEF